MILALPAAAREETAQSLTSSFVAPGYPAPEVPPCDRLPDETFAGAVLIGDSLAVGLDANYALPEMRFIAKVGISPRVATLYHVYPKSRGSDKKVHLLDLLADPPPTAIYLWLGANGIDTADASVILKDYEGLLNLLIGHYPDIPLYVMELTPVGPQAKERYFNLTNENIDAFNLGLRDLARQHQVYFLPINALLRGEDGALSAEHGAGDGIHLRSTGYDLIAEYLYTHAVPHEEGTP